MNDSEFWRSRAWIRYVHDYAKAENINPFALLVMVLLRESLRIPPNLLIPSLGIGGRGRVAGVNVFVALVGGPGDGKDTTEGAACDLVPDILDADVHLPVSGEGIAAMFADRVPDLDDKGKRIGSHQACRNPRVLLSVSEVGQLSGAARISSSTLISTLLNVFMGKQFGAFNRNADNRLQIPAYAYRLGMSVNAQPSAADAFTEYEGLGWPQRFMWADVLDPDCDTDKDNRTKHPKGEFTWHVRYESPSPAAFDAVYRAESWDAYRKQPRQAGCDSYELVELEYPRQALDDAFRDSVARNRGTRSPLDSHTMLLTAHVAAVVASMRASDLKVSADDWMLARKIVDMSNKCRERYLSKAKENATAKLADEMQVKDDARTEAEARVFETVKRRVLTVLDNLDPSREGVKGYEIRKKCGRYQKRCYDAIESLRDGGDIEQVGTSTGKPSSDLWSIAIRT